MARAIEFPEVDHHEATVKPSNVTPLPVKRFDDANVSCWQLSDAEKENGIIWLVNSTFGELPPPPEGERYQATLLITANKEAAMDRAANWKKINKPTSE